MKPRHRRMAFILLGMGMLGSASALVLNAFQSNLVFFNTPSEVAAGSVPSGRAFRLGGLVEEGSLKRDAQGLGLQFVVTDTAQRVTVRYSGLLPDLFQEGKGVVAQGRLAADGRFVAASLWPGPWQLGWVPTTRCSWSFDRQGLTPLLGRPWPCCASGRGSCLAGSCWVTSMRSTRDARCRLRPRCWCRPVYRALATPCRRAATWPARCSGSSPAWGQ